MSLFNFHYKQNKFFKLIELKGSTMIHPEYKVVNDSIYLPEGGKGLQSKTRLKFVQNKKAVALYDGSAYVGLFVLSKKNASSNRNQNWRFVVRKWFRYVLTGYSTTVMRCRNLFGMTLCFI